MRYTKDPEATLDYVFDWSSWLASGETITSFVMTVPDGITQGTGGKAASQADGKITVWLSGGSVGVVGYLIGCKITTSIGRVDERQILINIADR